MVAPVKTSPQSAKISRNSGSFRGSLSAWQPPYAHSLEHQAYERKLSQSRASDLIANDWAANSGINAITTNAVGTGLKPQSQINAKRLGITKEQALEEAKAAAAAAAAAAVVAGGETDSADQQHSQGRSDDGENEEAASKGDESKEEPPSNAMETGSDTEAMSDDCSN